MHQISLGCPGPAGGAYSAPSDPLAGLKGPTSKGRGGRIGGRGEKGRGGGGTEGGGERAGEGPMSLSPPEMKSCMRP